MKKRFCYFLHIGPRGPICTNDEAAGAPIMLPNSEYCDNCIVYQGIDKKFIYGKGIIDENNNIRYMDGDIDDGIDGPPPGDISVRDLPATRVPVRVLRY